MNAEVINKVLKITELALLINPTNTTQQETGSKPTVFLTFYGHCNHFKVLVCTNGWSRMEEQNEYESYETYYLSENPEELDRAIERLTEIYQKYKGGNGSDIV